MILAVVFMDSCTDSDPSSHHNKKRRQLTFSSLQSVNLNSDCYLRTNARRTIAFSIKPTNIKAAETTYRGTPIAGKSSEKEGHMQRKVVGTRMEID